MYEQPCCDNCKYQRESDHNRDGYYCEVCSNKESGVYVLYHPESFCCFYWERAEIENDSRAISAGYCADKINDILVDLQLNHADDLVIEYVNKCLHIVINAPDYNGNDKCSLKAEDSPKAQTAKWILIRNVETRDIDDGSIERYNITKCSNCGYETTKQTPFCPMCGFKTENA